MDTKPRMIPLEDLTLLDRFLFSEAADDAEFMEDVLSIIMGEDILLKGIPQTEKEVRNQELRKYIKLDVFAEDEKENVYDTEVQKKNTGNLPKRSRYYQAMTDTKLLQIGDTDYENLNRVYTIMIGPFDLFGKHRYMYTFRMNCMEEPDIDLNDDAFRVFLNTRGTDAENISPELKFLLEFFENPTEEVAEQSGSERIKRMQKRVKTLKASEETGAKYMREWEEKALERKEARAVGLAEGRSEMQECMNRLNQKLIADGRIDDLMRSTEDKAFQKQLFAEYRIEIEE